MESRMCSRCTVLHSGWPDGDVGHLCQECWERACSESWWAKIAGREDGLFVDSDASRPAAHVGCSVVECRGPWVCDYPGPAETQRGTRWTCPGCGTRYVMSRHIPARPWRNWSAPNGHWKMTLSCRVRLGKTALLGPRPLNEDGSRA